MNNKTILIVDDEEDVRAITVMGLEMSVNWRILSASSGKDALKMAKEHQPDVILLDWMMPDMDGRTTLQHLKKNPLTQTIPVILVTAKEQDSVFNSENLEIAAMISKPFRPLKLAEQIKEALQW
ncbi:response regulator [Aphanothece hegewaldii]|uniref:response regulator n=1 Tax=Aphanothece hegewaldii TaxID=1521625 RepID=UPI001FE4A72C|nr:response regulator [Aphanothece hegewaldii]